MADQRPPMSSSKALAMEHPLPPLQQTLVTDCFGHFSLGYPKSDLSGYAFRKALMIFLEKQHGPTRWDLARHLAGPEIENDCSWFLKPEVESKFKQVTGLPLREELFF